LYLLTAVLLGLDLVLNAATAAATAASSGRQPAAYFGIQATLTCVYPVTTATAMAKDGGPLPVGRPLLSFGAKDGWLWLWDPKTHRPISVPQLDVSVFPTAGAPARCTPKTS